tara:strand:- start:3099 stop:3350 length:252 start_codon:yes stop_codon:yes gene_type:complete
MMDGLVEYLIYGAIGLLTLVLKSMWRKVDELRGEIEETKLDMVKRESENKELYHNIQRVDRNIDDLFDKIDCVLTDSLCNRKK